MEKGMCLVRPPGSSMLRGLLRSQPSCGLQQSVGYLGKGDMNQGKSNTSSNKCLHGFKKIHRGRDFSVLVVHTQQSILSITFWY